MQIISKRLKCLEGFLKVFDLVSVTEPLPSLLSGTSLLSSWLLTWTSMRCIYLQKQTKNCKRTNITTCNSFNFMSIYGSFTVVWDISGQLICLQSGPCFPEVSSALSHVSRAELMLTLGRCRGNSADPERFTEKQIKQPFSVPHAVRMQWCWPVRPQGCENHQHEAVFLHCTSLVFLHIKMYMIGMHIIFLLTDSFNKALCQSAVMVLTFCLLWG